MMSLEVEPQWREVAGNINVGQRVSLWVCVCGRRVGDGVRIRLVSLANTCRRPWIIIWTRPRVPCMKG